MQQPKPEKAKKGFWKKMSNMIAKKPSKKKETSDDSKQTSEPAKPASPTIPAGPNTSTPSTESSPSHVSMPVSPLHFAPPPMTLSVHKEASREEDDKDPESGVSSNRPTAEPEKVSSGTVEAEPALEEKHVAPQDEAHQSELEITPAEIPEKEPGVGSNKETESRVASNSGAEDGSSVDQSHNCLKELGLRTSLNGSIQGNSLDSSVQRVSLSGSVQGSQPDGSVHGSQPDESTSSEKHDAEFSDSNTITSEVSSNRPVADKKELPQGGKKPRAIAYQARSWLKVDHRSKSDSKEKKPLGSLKPTSSLPALKPQGSMVTTLKPMSSLATTYQEASRNRADQPRQLMTEGSAALNSADSMDKPDVRRVRNELETARLQRQVLLLEAELRKERDAKDPSAAPVEKLKTRIRTLNMNLESQAAKHEARLAEIGTELEEARMAATTAKADNARLSAQIAALQAQHDQVLREQQAELHKAVDDSSRKERALTFDLEAANKAYKAAEQALNDARRKQEELEERLQEINVQNEDSKVSVQEVVTSLKLRTTELEATEKMLSDARISQEELAKDLEAARVEVQEAKQQLNAALKLAKEENSRAVHLECKVIELTTRIMSSTGSEVAQQEAVGSDNASEAAQLDSAPQSMHTMASEDADQEDQGEGSSGQADGSHD